MTPGKPIQPVRSRLHLLAPGAVIAAATFAAYHNSFHGQLAFDDVPTITDNPSIRHLANLKAVLSPPPGGFTVSGRPLLNFSLAVDYAIAGKHVWTYHATNLLIHILAALVLFGIMRRTLRRMPAEVPPSGTKAGGTAIASAAIPLAFIVALLWAVHPLQTEAVTYIVQRAESLMALFYLLTLYCFILFVESVAEKVERTVPRTLMTPPELRTESVRGTARSTFLAVGSIVFCLLGMATKEVMVSAPVIVLLYDRTFIAGSFAEAWRKRRGYYIGLACTWALLGWLLLNNSTRGRTVGVDMGIRPIDYWLTQFHAIVHYLRLVVWPRPLVIDYGTHIARSLGDIWPYFLIVAALVAGTVWCFFRSPALGFCGIFFFAILAPTCVIPVVVQVMAEHRMYLALAPVLAVAVVGAFRFLEWLAAKGAMPGHPLRCLVAACVAAAAGLGFVTERRNNDYRNELTLWGKTAAESPDNPRAIYNYGLALADAKDVKGAMIHYQRALELKPFYPEAHNNLGIALSQTGHWDEAMAEFRIAADQDPTFGKAFYNIGNVYMHEQRLTDAISYFEEAEHLTPDYTDIYYNLGIALTREGRPDEAVPVYEHALELKPDEVYVESNLGAVFDSLNRLPEAIACYRAALKLNPKLSKTRNDLGTALARTGHLDEATAQFELAVQIDPTFYLARLNLGHALMLSGRTQEAQAQYLAASRLPPADSGSDYGPESGSEPQNTP